MSDYHTAWDTLADTIGAADGKSSGSIMEQDHLSIDQRLKVAEIAALLSISQELSALNPQNTETRDEDGNTRNGWGTIIKEAKKKPGRINRSAEK